MWTIVNLIDRFCHQYDFFVVTGNYDSAGSKMPFDSVVTNEWNKVGNAHVFYFGGGNISVKTAISLVDAVKPDCIFLNSAFGVPSLRFLTARRKRLIWNIPVILAPCGELGSGSLSLKPLKKRLFLHYSKVVQLYRGIIWKASSEVEKKDIAAAMGQDVEILVAPDLVPRTILPGYSQQSKPKKVSGEVRFVFMSRIVAKKNIHFFLECLREVREGDITFDIIGPIEDKSYWSRCESLISELPGNVAINVIGPLQRNQAIYRVFQSHFFVLPTLNENFGYVLIESLAAGTPLLISDQTMWNELESSDVGWTIPLDRPDLYMKAIKTCVEMDEARFSEVSSAARAYALKWLDNASSDRSMAKVLEMAVNRASGDSDG